VGKARNGHEFISALSEALRYDTAALVEKALDAREIEVAVLGNETPKISGLGEILPGEEFYSYADKYSAASSARLAVPAQVSEAQSAQIRAYAETAYKAIGGHGMARIDFFIEKETGAIYLNEINSIPGFTNISMYPKLWQAAGVGYGQLIDELIRYAVESDR
jgi:D-alanine-D-alanine ligase